MKLPIYHAMREFKNDLHISLLKLYWKVTFTSDTPHTNPLPYRAFLESYGLVNNLVFVVLYLYLPANEAHHRQENIYKLVLFSLIHQLIGFYGSRIQANWMVDIIMHRKWHFLCCCRRQSLMMRKPDVLHYYADSPQKYGQNQLDWNPHTLMDFQLNNVRRLVLQD